jgi:enoyl-[acyl-carrier-protein] reductase (NADH)
MKEKIIVSLRDLIQSQQALSQIVGMEFSASVAFGLAKAIRKIEAELANYEQARLKLVDRIKDLPEETEEQKLESSRIREEADQEYEKLIAQEVTFDFAPFDIKQFEKLKISPRDLLALSWLITE